MESTGQNELFPEIQEAVDSLEALVPSPQREDFLGPITTYLQQKLDAKEPVRLVFVCTHNSRRSHLAQVWAQVLARYHRLGQVECYSAGTQATALFPTVVKTLERQGFQINPMSQGDNPIYAIKFGPHQHPVIGFSKELDHPFNPSSGFAAIMVCDQADQDCPFVAGAQARFSLPYEDPKKHDQDNPQKAYLDRSLQIATELNYIFSKLTFKNGK